MLPTTVEDRSRAEFELAEAGIVEVRSYGERTRKTTGTRIKETAIVGVIEASIELSNPSKPKLKPLTVRAIVDTGP